LPIGETNQHILLSNLGQKLCQTFPSVGSVAILNGIPMPKEAYNSVRKQYNSIVILNELHKYGGVTSAEKILGVTNLDLYVPQLNFVFGQAECPGKIALISLYRLRPEFYGLKKNEELFLERVLKEAVHELGHTFGVRHCADKRCVMYFSNSILDTDNKFPFFCANCLRKLKMNMEY